MFTSREEDSSYTTESKYVADILSSMANGEPVTPNYSLPGYLSGVTTATTPTLTPTTLASIERTFIELQSVPVSSASQDPLTQSGFVPPIVDPVSQEHSRDGFDYSDSNSDQEWLTSAKRPYSDVDGNTPSYQSTSGRKRRRYDDKDLTPEECERRRVRRERNKVAAAKCRQRRVDHTNQLVDETDKLENERSSLESEIQSLQQQKDQLEFILQAHQPLCKVESAINMKVDTVKVKTEPHTHVSCAARSSESKFSSPSTHRPSSLSLVKQEKKTVAGVPISTPSSGLFSFNGLDSLVDGGTGLTPVSTSCASQAHRSSSESGSEAVGSPTLISL
ncbi:fos-related antigen 1-like isoform X1 [Haliotis asinina]|uniref:fos-related antigen 1-like isoform X1 n=1 Tax=Haliotis asinina TaxID=109174 RepID=UPI0035320F52